jgi:hypothetical protein
MYFARWSSLPCDQFEQAALVRDRRVTTRQLFHHERVRGDVEPGTAERLRHRDAEQAEFAHLLVNLRWKALLAIERFGHGPDHRMRKTARCVADLLVRFREFHAVSCVIVIPDFSGTTRRLR